MARHLSASRNRQVEVALEEQAPAWRETRRARHSRKADEGPSAYQQDRLARYQHMIQLHEQGMTQGAIAQQIGVRLNTVRALARQRMCLRLRAAPTRANSTPTSPLFGSSGHKDAITSPRFARELGAQGYRGTYASVHDNIVRRLQFGGRKTPAEFSPKTPLLATSRQAVFLFLRPPEELRPHEQETVTILRQIHLEVDLAYDLVQQFARDSA